MKIHAYRVVPRGNRSLADVINYIDSIPFENRIRRIAGNDIRMEAKSSFQQLHFLDFTKIRYDHGPGKSSRTAPTTGFELGEDEGFGEETAALFDSSSNYLIVQYNHNGPRAGALGSYFYRYALAMDGLERAPAEQEEDDSGDNFHGFNLGVVMKPDAYDRLREKEIMKSLEFTISVPGARASDRARGRSLSSVLDAPLPEGLETITVSMRARRTRDASLDRDTVMHLVNDLRRLGGEVSHLRVKARSAEAAKAEEIDLLEDRLQVDLRITPGPDRRYPRQERWNRLHTAYDRWRESGDLPV